MSDITNTFRAWNWWHQSCETLIVSLLWPFTGVHRGLDFFILFFPFLPQKAWDNAVMSAPSGAVGAGCSCSKSSSQPDSRRSETGTVWPVTAPSRPPLINKQANWINKQIALLPASWSTIKRHDKLFVNALTAGEKMKKNLPQHFLSNSSPTFPLPLSTQAPDLVCLNAPCPWSFVLWQKSKEK